MIPDIGPADLNHGQPAATAIIERCATEAASRRGIDPDLLLAIIMTGERGNMGMINANANGSYDLGVAQINTIQWQEPWFRSSYPDWRIVAQDTCTNISAAADILHHRIAELPADASIWNAVGHYHSRTGRYKLSYLQRVMSGYRARAERRGSGFDVRVNYNRGENER